MPPTRPAAAERRRQILDAAVKVFAARGFTQCRVSDIADEAGVAYGLLYHYFRSKDEVLSTLFKERWDLLVALIDEVRTRPGSTRAKLEAIAEFIVGSYRRDPDLMKVIIVEVTRAANSFGRTHLPDIERAYVGIAAIVADGQATGELRRSVSPDFAAMAFYGAIEQVLTVWILADVPFVLRDTEQVTRMLVETICEGLNG